MTSTGDRIPIFQPPMPTVIQIKYRLSIPPPRNQSIRMAEPAWSRLLDDDERAVMQRYGRARSPGLDGRRPALLVIDAVESFVGPNILVASAQEEAVTACGELAWQAIPHISALLDGWRQRQLPVFFSTVRLAPNSRASVERCRDGRLRSDALKVAEPCTLTGITMTGVAAEMAATNATGRWAMAPTTAACPQIVITPLKIHNNSPERGASLNWARRLTAEMCTPK